MSSAKVKVLASLMEEPDEQHYGYELMRTTGVKSGSLYPILEQLERVGWLVSNWESIDEENSGRPPRRWYRLTVDGRRAAPLAVEAFVGRRAGDVQVSWKPGLAT